MNSVVLLHSTGHNGCSVDEEHKEAHRAILGAQQVACAPATYILHAIGFDALHVAENDGVTNTTDIDATK